jgi:membrane fusion protein (multidrug efflux system)
MNRSAILLPAALLVVSAVVFGLVARADRGNAGAAPEASSVTAPDAADSSSAGEQPAARRVAPLPVEGFVVERAPFTEIVRATGRAEANRRAELALPVGGTVSRVAVREGDRVDAGATLLALDPRPLEIDRDEARARLAKAESDFELLGIADSSLTAERRRLIEDRKGVTEARSALARAELDLAEATLVAPFAGEIADVQVVRGERAPADRAVVTLVETHPIRVRAEVLESDLGRVAAGATATLRFPAWPDETFRGTVETLDPEVDPDRGTGVALVTVENRDGRIRPGMYAEVAISGASHADRLRVPREAVLERDRRLLVFRASDGRAEWQYVKTGLETRESIEIVDGLAPGDTVLVSGHLTLAHGAPVRVKLR